MFVFRKYEQIKERSWYQRHGYILRHRNIFVLKSLVFRWERQQMSHTEIH